MKRSVWNVGNNKKKGSWKQATVGLILFRCDYAETTIIIIIIFLPMMLKHFTARRQKLEMLKKLMRFSVPTSCFRLCHACTTNLLVN